MNIRWLLRVASIALLIASVVGLAKAREHARGTAELVENSASALVAARSQLQGAEDLAKVNRRPSLAIGDGAAQLLAYLRVSAPAAGVQFNFLSVGAQTTGGVSPAAVSTLATKLAEGDRAVAFYVTGVGSYRDLPEFVRWCDGLADLSAAVVKLDASGHEIRQITLAVYGVL